MFEVPFTGYPTLRAAALHILYDNGMVNRHTTEGAELRAAWRRIRKHSAIDAVETELSKLNAQQLETACVDSESIEGFSISAHADEALNLIFEDTQ